MKLHSLARCGWIALFAITATAQAEDRPAVKDVDPATVAAYQKINGSYLRARIDDNGFVFQRGHPLVGECMPAFSFGGAGPQGPLIDLDEPFCLQFTSWTDERLKDLASLEHLAALDIRGANLTLAAGKRMAALKNLRGLALWDSGAFTNAGLKELAALKELSVLYLWNSSLTDEDMKELAAFKSLRMLSVNSTKITDAGLRELNHCANLRTLYLDCNMLTDTNLRALRQAGLLYKLRQAKGPRDLRPKSVDEVTVLDLNYAPVLDAGLKELASLKNLGFLNLNDTRVTDAGLKELAGFKKLNALHLRNTLVTDTGLKELEGLTQLTELDLRKTKVTDTGMAYLREALPKCNVLR
jgi:hypothetical protein